MDKTLEDAMKIVDWSRKDKNNGVPLRDWFAGQALQSYTAAFYSSSVSAITSESDAREIAEGSYMIADAMMKARGDD